MSAKWDWNQSSATGQQGCWTIELDPLHPTRFVQFCPTSESMDAWNAVSIEPLPSHALQAEELYVRESDLIVRFGQSPADQYALQLNWQLLENIPSVAHGVELWVSIQTNLLDSSPRLRISSEGEFAGWHLFQHEELLGREPVAGCDHSAAALVSASTADTTRLWLIEPSDQSQARLLTAADEAVQRVQLFGQFLEKGVIRRARMRFMIIDGDLPPSQLKALYQSFANSPLPLTA